MKAKIFVLLMLMPIMVLSNNYFEGVERENNRPQKMKPSKKRRYRLDNKAKNFFSIGKNRIAIEVPVTYRKIRIKRKITNISSDSINAVLVWLKTDDDVLYTPCDGEMILKSRKFKISKLKGLKKQLSGEEDKKLVIAFWIDSDEPDYSVENRFREIIRKSVSYDEAVEILNSDNCNQDEKSSFNVEQPRESGGDVIGGK